VSDPLQQDDAPADAERPRQRYLLEDTGFDEVPKKYRKFYRKWRGALVVVRTEQGTLEAHVAY
jgi:hypothetical protein